jgi:hypothetical protein
LSSVQQSAIAPCRDTRPYVGRRPVTPHAVDGNRIEPEVSDPIAKPTRPADTAIAEPLDDPPLQYFAFHGVRPGPVNDASASPYPKPPASSTIASFASSTAPASVSFFTTVASKSNRCRRYGCAPQVVGASGVASRSFTPYGIPCSGPRTRPRARSRSARLASARARSCKIVTTAL